METPNLALVGFMASGKSTVGRLCAERLGFAFVDTDVLIERRAGCSVREVFAAQGESAFREMETEAVAEAVGRNRVVIASGGGAVLRAENVELLRERCVVVYLRVEVGAVMARTEGDTSRPLLARGEEAARQTAALLESRDPYYRAAAHAIVDSGKSDPVTTADRVLSVYGLHAARRAPSAERAS